MTAITKVSDITWQDMADYLRLIETTEIDIKMPTQEFQDTFEWWATDKKNRGN